MKIILSRKGFDSAAGGAASPIRNGKPISMPIPASRSSLTTYGDIGLGAMVEQITGGRMAAGDLCHHDPMFVGNECWFGQCDAAQSHLANQGVGPGDIFLFFGLFRDELTREKHHRIFGYLKVRHVYRVDTAAPEVIDQLTKLRHPHVLGIRSSNNTVYYGEGATASTAPQSLRLTRMGGPLLRWTVPRWLRKHGLSYHGAEKRWVGPTELEAVVRGQEFVCDIGENTEALAWVRQTIEAIHS